jgi:hypothetical protein
MLLARLGAHGLVAASLIGLWLTSPRPAQTAEPVDLALVLAVDVSLSVDQAEFALQLSGIASAFRDRRVWAAIEAAAPRGVAVTLVQWGDSSTQETGVGWQRITDARSAARFATAVEAVKRAESGLGTSIDRALRFSLASLEQAPFQARRRVIDLSGDGRHNQGAGLQRVRVQAAVQGVTVNGLAIREDYPALDSFYWQEVVIGTGAFVQSVDSFADFEDGILRKLIREITGTPVA